MKALSKWYITRLRQYSADSCTLDPCDHGPRHQLIHVDFQNYLPKIEKRLRRAALIEYSTQGYVYSVSSKLPKRFISLTRNTEAEEIAYEYLVNNYSYDVYDCRIRTHGSSRAHLIVWFRSAQGIE